MICTYCGVPCDTLDHAVPHAYAGVGPKSFERSKVVPACRECNTALGTQLFQSIGERAAWLKGWLANRHKKILKIPEWDEDDLEDLSPDMRAYVQAGISEKAYVRARLEHAELVSLTNPSIDDVWDNAHTAAP